MILSSTLDCSYRFLGVLKKGERTELEKTKHHGPWPHLHKPVRAIRIPTHETAREMAAQQIVELFSEAACTASIEIRTHKLPPQLVDFATSYTTRVHRLQSHLANNSCIVAS